MHNSKRDVLLGTAAVIGILFGLLTLASGGRALLGAEEARQSVGAYVSFVLWFNFVAGFFYVVAGVGIWLRRRWSVPLAAMIALATALVFAAFGLHVLSGGAYESRTTAAMALRTVVWAAIAWTGWSKLRAST
jgi:hypothetical protein